MERDKEERYNIRVLDRAIRVLGVLSDGRARSLTELSDRIEISTSTTFRLLATLAYHGYLERDDQTGKYRLGLACLELARAYHKSSDLRQQALSEMEKLRDETGETVHLGVLNELEVVYLEKLPGHHAIGLMSSTVGGRTPAYCTGVGKVLLAYQEPALVQAHFSQTGLYRYTTVTIPNVDQLMSHLKQIRKQGYGFDRGEHEAEVRCVAAPIFDIKDKVIAAISVSGPAGRLEPLEANHSLIERTLRAAAAISARLGYSPASCGDDST